MLQVAVLGVGYIAQNHIRAWLKNPYVQICAVICLEQDIGMAMSQKIGNNCKYYASLDAALSSAQIHIVDVCVPTYLHETFVIQAANAGCHVLCEKPVTFSLESFDRMYAACKENNVKFMVAQVERWAEEFVRIKELLTDGSLGKLHMMSMNRLSQHPSWSVWHRDPMKSGGGLYDLMVHDIDYIYSVFGKPASVYATGWKNETDCWNHITTQMKWQNGECVVCEDSLEMTGNFPFTKSLRATGDLGTLLFQFSAGANINDAEHVVKLQWFGVGEEHRKEIQLQQIDPFEKELSGFVSAISSSTIVPIPPEESREVLQMVLAIKESLETQQIVYL